MATSLLLEGEDLEALLLRAAQEGGPGARIVRAEKVRAGGVMGFFARERFEVAVEIPDDDTEQVPGPATRRALRAIPHPRDAADTFEDLREPLPESGPASNPEPGHGQDEQEPEQPYEQAHLAALVDLLADGVKDDVEVGGLETGGFETAPASGPVSAMVARAYGSFGPGGVSSSPAVPAAVRSGPSAEVAPTPAPPTRAAADQPRPTVTPADLEVPLGDHVATSSGRHAAPPAGEPAPTHPGHQGRPDELVRLINGELSPAGLAAEGLLGVVDRISAAERAATRSVAGQPLAEPQELVFSVPLPRPDLAGAAADAERRSIQLPPEVEVGQAAQSAAYAAMYAAAHTGGVVPADARWQAATFPVASRETLAGHEPMAAVAQLTTEPAPDRVSAGHDTPTRFSQDAPSTSADLVWEGGAVLGSVLGETLAEPDPALLMTPTESGQLQNVPTPAHMVTGYTGQGTQNGTVPHETPPSTARPSTARPEFTALLDQLRAGTRSRSTTADATPGLPTGSGTSAGPGTSSGSPLVAPDATEPGTDLHVDRAQVTHVPSSGSVGSGPVGTGSIGVGPVGGGPIGAPPVAPTSIVGAALGAVVGPSTRPELASSHLEALQQSARRQTGRLEFALDSHLGSVGDTALDPAPDTDRWAQDAAAAAARMVHQQLDAERSEAARYDAWRHEQERSAQQRIAQERWEAQAAQAALMEAERQAHLNAQTQTIEAEAAEAIRVEAARLEAQRAAAQQAEAARQEAEAAAVVRAEAERIAAEQIAAHRREAERLAAELAEAERVAAEHAQAERLAAAQAAAEHAQAERLAAELAEAERVAAELAEAERVAAERAEKAEAERVEAERAAAAREDAARREALRVEDERLAAQRAEADLAEAHWVDPRRVPAPRTDAPRPAARRPQNGIAGAGGLSSVGQASVFSTVGVNGVTSTAGAHGTVGGNGTAEPSSVRTDVYETSLSDVGQDYYEALARSSEAQVAADRSMLRDLGLPSSWTRRLRTGDRFSAVLKMLEPMPVVDIDPDVAVVAVVGPAHLVHLEAYRTAADLPVGGRPRPVVVVPATVGPARAAELARSQRHTAVVVAIETPWYDGVEMVLESLQTIRAGAVIAIVDAERPLLETQGWLDDLGSVDALAVDGATTVPRPAAALQLGLPIVRLDGIPIDHLTWTALLCAQLEAAKPAESRT